MSNTRRSFLQTSTLTAALVAGSHWQGLAADSPARAAAPAAGGVPWYRRARRWGQTNITEIDPARYDIAWWRGQWQRTRTQGIVVNAGGIVAYYPTRIPLHRRAAQLGDRDLFGELCRAAHEDGIAVFARMDSSSAHEEFYRAHPDWFAVDTQGRPFRRNDLYQACINGPYYHEHIPAILREIVARYQPEGFTDNSWSGLGRNSICHCVHCRRKFRAHADRDLPRAKDWDDPVYRLWIKWSYARRVEVWDAFNRVTRTAGGPHCLWVGMNSGSVSGQAQRLRDCAAIARRAEMLMLDDQRRANESGFQRNGEVGKLMHGLLGWDKLMPESMAMYQSSTPTYRLASKPGPEARMWMLAGFAGGIQPWWHHVGAYHEDRRMYRTAVEPCQWHARHEEFLHDRRPIATIGVVWSQENTDFHGRDDANLLVDLPQRGLTQALIRARLPYLMVHADDIEREAAQLRLLILPDLVVLSDAQVANIRRFVARGGGLLATGQSSLGNEWGDPRPDFALADLFGAHLPPDHGARHAAQRLRWAAATTQSYLRLTPELRARVDGPHVPGEPSIAGERHRVLHGFDETDIMPFGGTLAPLRLDPSARVLLTFIPSFPVMPPEAAWMRQPKTDIAGLVLHEKPGAGRVAYLAADLDRRYARDNLPDHGDLLANLARWAARDDLPLAVEGPGLIDCHLYRQPGRVILHLVNLTSAGTWRAPVEELIPVGPLRVRIRLPDDVGGRNSRLLVSGEEIPVTTEHGWSRLELKSVLDHEVIVLD
jgi:hypothetical protein